MLYALTRHHRRVHCAVVHSSWAIGGEHIQLQQACGSIMLTQAENAADTEPSFAELPADFIGLLCSVLPVRDLVAASCTCKRWQTCIDTEWEGRCRARWRHWKTPLPPSHGLAAAPSSSSTSTSRSTASWKRLYQMRHERDATIFKLLQDTCWPDKQEAAYSSLVAMGADAIDALAAAAHSSCASSMFVGLTYQAHVALHFVVGEMCAQQLQQLITAQQQQGADGASAGRPSAAAAEAPQSHGQTAAGEAVAGTNEKADVTAALDGALLLAQALHPLSDVSAVKRLVQQLGEELRARMHQAQAAPGSRQAVQLLNKLLFGPPAAAAAAATTSPNSSSSQSKSSAAAAGAPAGAAGGCHAAPGPSSSSSSSGNGLRFGWWLRDAELDGPDLSQLAVPTGGCSGLGMKGNTPAYYDANNSCLDAVLGQRAGMPITLALLHAAVAVEGGLRVEMVNIPGHIINKAWIVEGTADTAQAEAGLHGGSDRGRGGARANQAAAGSSTASSSVQPPQRQQGGENPNSSDHVIVHDLASAGSQLGIVRHPLKQQQSSGRWVYLDAFDGGREMEEQEIRQFALRFVHDAQDPQLTLPGALDEVLQRWGRLTAPLCLRRMLFNLVNSLKLGYAAHSGQIPTIGVSSPRPLLHLLHLRTISVALLALTLIPATTTQVQEAFDVFVQLIQLVGLGQVAAPPGAVLLMRKIVQIMPPQLHTWKVKLEMMLRLFTQQQQDQQLQVHLRSNHPSVQFRVGQYVLLTRPGAAPKTGFVLSWSVAEEPESRTTHAGWIAGGPAAAAASVVASAIAAVGGEPSSQGSASPSEVVSYKLLLDDCTVETSDQQNIVCHHCQQRPCAADESLHSEFERLSNKHAHKLKYLQHAWFETQFLRGLSEVGSSPSAAAETEAASELWPEQHMALGRYFDAVRPDGWPIAVANAALRAKFPEG